MPAGLPNALLCASILICPLATNPVWPPLPSLCSAALFLCRAADKYSGAGYMLYKGFNKMGKRMEGASATLGKQLNSAVGATPGQRCSLPVRMRDCSLQVCRCECSLPVRLAVDSTSRLEWIMAAGSVCDCQ